MCIGMETANVQANLDSKQIPELFFVKFPIALFRLLSFLVILIMYNYIQT